MGASADGNGDGACFPVIFFDGERETEIGDVFVYKSLSFKNFQSILSGKIGISPHQITIYLVDSRRSRLSPRKVPITSKVDFGAFLHEKDCVFFVVLKRSRRERRRRGGDWGKKVRPPANVMLLRRSPAGDDGDRPFSVLLPLVEYESRVRRLEIGFRDLRLDGDTANRRVAVGNGGDTAVCEECLRAAKTGRDREFHWCVYDTVTVGFRSPAGPLPDPDRDLLRCWLVHQKHRTLDRVINYGVAR